MVILAVLKILEEKPNNSVKLLNACIFQIFTSAFIVLYAIFYLIFVWKTAKSERLRTKEVLKKSIILKKAFLIPVGSHSPVALPLKWRSFIHPEKTYESCSVSWRLLGSFGRELCFRDAVLSPWVPFHRFPIVHPSHCMFVTATAAMCKIDHSWPKLLWAQNQEQVQPWSKPEGYSVGTTSSSDNRGGRSKTQTLFYFCVPDPSPRLSCPLHPCIK